MEVHDSSKRLSFPFHGEPQSDLTTSVAAAFHRKPCDARSGLCSALPIDLHGTPTLFQVSNRDRRLIESETASTTGRSSVGEFLNAEELVSLIQKQNLEIDAFVRQQTEKFRLEIDRARRRHYQALIQAFEGSALHALRAKEAELEFIARRNAELEERLVQLATDNQLWIHIARNNEAAVSNLRATLEHVVETKKTTPSEDLEEGFGESEFPPSELCRRSFCKICLEREASVLVLPCRHLCLCDQCDVAIDTCPVCTSAKSASLQVFMA
ncbi:BOI-related E3 ubiquitin-protein ligase 1-like [Wolffia australiana]